jgi:hypothetical protein
LREKWYQLARQKLDATTVNKFVHPLNSDLSYMWDHRGAIIHGRWYPSDRRGWYRLEYWVQTDTLRRYRGEHSLAKLRRFADDLERILSNIYAYHERAAQGLPPPSQTKKRLLRQRPINQKPK